MTSDHDRFTDAIADLDDLTTLPDDLETHRAACDECNRRLDLMRKIHTTARHSAAEADNDAVDVDVTSVVLDVTHPRRGGRARLLLAAAAAVVVVAGAGVLISSQSQQPADVLAEIAEDLRGSQGTRFVLSTESTVNVADEFDLPSDGATAVEPLSNPLPRCPGDEPNPTPNTGLDLAPIVDALTADDPCRALALIDDNVSEPVAATYAALSTSIEQTSQRLDALRAAEATSELTAASADAYRTEREQQLTAAQSALDDLTDTFATLATTLRPLADTDAGESANPGVVGEQLVALQASVATADAAIIDDESTVEWSQIATGTWSPSELIVSGTTEQGNRNSTFTGVDDDPLGLASIILGSPEQLVAILESAPASNDATIEWELPAELVDGPQRWTATARQTDGQLDDLTIRSGGTTITLTLGR